MEQAAAPTDRSKAVILHARSIEHRGRYPGPPDQPRAETASACPARFGDEVRPLAVRVRDDWSPRDVAVPLMHDRGADMHRAYDAKSASVYLIRPDGYLAWRADWADRHALLEFLGTACFRRSEGR